MARFRQYANESQIKNLTNKPYKVFCTTGGYTVFEPTLYDINDGEDILYICSTGSKDWLEKNGVDENRLFFASCTGINRNGEFIWALHPYNVELPRLVPHRES